MNEYVGKKVPGAEPAKGAYRTQQPGKMLFSRSVGREIQSPFNAVEVGIAFSFCLFPWMRECFVRSEVAPPICLPAGCRQARGRKRLKNIPLAVSAGRRAIWANHTGARGKEFFSSSFFCPWAVALFTVQDPSVSFARTRGGPQRDRRRRRLLRRPLPEWRGEDDKRPFLLLLFLSLVLFALSLLLFFSFHFPFSGKNLVRESPTSVVKFPLGADCALPRGQKVSSPLLLSWSIEIN